MRSRNIKPDFFINEDLAELEPYARLLFIGLWCYADREGIFEWRPKRIKAAIFPYDDKVNVEKLLMSLHDMTFIYMYLHRNTKYGKVINFLEHQKPHPHERKSTFPKPEQNQCHDMSLNVTKCKPDIMNEDIRKEDTVAKSDFENLWLKYPRKEGKKEAFRHFKASVLTEDDLGKINIALDNYIGTRKGEDAKFTKAGSTWFNNWEDWITVDKPKPDVQSWPELNPKTGVFA